MKSQDLKIITEKYSADQLEACIRQQLDKGENACEKGAQNAAQAFPPTLIKPKGSFAR